MLWSPVGPFGIFRMMMKSRRGENRSRGSSSQLVVLGWGSEHICRCYDLPDLAASSESTTLITAWRLLRITHDRVVLLDPSSRLTLLPARDNDDNDGIIHHLWKFLIQKASECHNARDVAVLGQSIAILLTSTEATTITHLSANTNLPQFTTYPIIIHSTACSDSHALLYSRDNRTVYSIGFGMHGELGLGPINHAASPTPIENFSYAVRNMAVGPHSSMIITEPWGHIYSFGCGSYYRLGHGDDDDVRVPKLIELLVGVGELNADGTTQGLDRVSCGLWHTVVIAKGSLDIFGFGWNKFGQLCGVETSAPILMNPMRMEFLDKFDGSNENEPNHQLVDVSCGNRHTALLTKSGRMLIL